jgi:hypothetical protein
VQHDWEHTVPKVAAAGPRISITFRHDTEAPATPSRPVSFAGSLAASRAAHPAGRRR